MSTDYPSNYDNLVNPVPNDNTSNPNHADQHANANDAIEAIERVLGTNPHGSFDSVKDRIAAVELALTAAIGVILDGGGAALLAGNTAFIRAPFKCTIQRFTLMADLTGTVTIQVIKDTWANYPPVFGDDISNGGLAITVDNKAEDSTLTGWTVDVEEGEIIGFRVVNNAEFITRVTCQLKVLRTL